MAVISKLQLPDTSEYQIRATGVLFGQVDSTSTATVFTATVPGLTEYYDGATVMLKNGVVTSASGFTININGLGAKPSYSNMATGNPVTPTDPTRDTTIFNINYAMLFVYSSTIVDGGGWICYRGYDANTNTIGYQLRTNSQSLPMKSITYRYRLLFTSADGKYYVPANNSTSTNATASRTVCQDKIDPFGAIYYYGTTASVAAGSRPSASYLWSQYTLSLGYSFNRTGAALVLTTYTPVYVKCAPQTDGSAIIDSTTPYVQALPTTDDGKIYIFLGIAYSATSIELVPEHPVYYYKDGQIRLYTNQVTSGSSVSPYTSNPEMDGTASAGSSNDYARGDHVHPSDTSRVPTSRKVNGKALSSDITLSASDVNALPSSTSIPTKVSDLTNDSGYITGIDSSDVTTALGYTPYNQTNPDGYISNETDPTVPAWAKESSKPTYTYSEITNTPTLATVATSGSYNDLSDTPTIPTDKVKLINVTITSIDPVIVGVSDTTSGDILTATNAGKLCVVKTSLGTTTMTAPLSLVDANAQDGAVAIFTYEDQSNPMYKYCTMTIVGTNVTFTFKDGYATTSQIPNVFANVKVGSTTIAADTTADTLELIAGTNITLTPDATNDTVTIAASGGSSVSPYTSNPAMNGTASAGSSNNYARGDHVHPSDTSRVPVSVTDEYNATSTINNTGGQIQLGNYKTVNGINNYSYAEVRPSSSSLYSSSINTTTGDYLENELEVTATETTIHNVVTPVSNGDAANKQYVDTQVATKQNTLVSGTNIKTINNTSLLGSGNIDIQSGANDFYINLTHDSTSEQYETDKSLAEIGVAYNAGKHLYIIDETKTILVYNYFIPDYIIAPLSVVPYDDCYIFEVALDNGYRVQYLLPDDEDGVALVSVDRYLKSPTDVSGATYTSEVSLPPIIGIHENDGTIYAGIDSGGLNYSVTTGTTSVIGNSTLAIGNSTASGTNGNKQGKLKLYGTSQYAVTLTPHTPLSGDRTITLPNVSGTLALTDIIAYQPVEGGMLYELDSQAQVENLADGLYLLDYWLSGYLQDNYQPILVSGTNIKTINNTSLLGSGNINVGLPTVTSSDNGKVLMVVNGQWAATSLPSANGVSF